MASERILRFAGLRPSPWRNGGGTTREIASGDDGSQEFSWRLSLAEIEQPGPFSLFPGTDRTFTVVSGEQVILTIEGREHTVRPRAPFCFSGGAAVTARLPAGPVRVLNVIARPEAVRAQVSVHELIPGQPCDVSGSSFAVLLSGHAAAHFEGTGTELETCDTAVGSRWRTRITGEGSLALVLLNPQERVPQP